ncbi:hypothetical protein EBS80_00510 [bacterium]|nr:hypothetical protein [bacterium]
MSDARDFHLRRIGQTAVSGRMTYVIVGGGIAGTTAAEELRKLDADASITLIGEEHEVIYSRVLLPHYAKGIVAREKIFLKKETWYFDKKIEWLQGTRCASIDAVNKHVTISDGRELPYDKLLITTGAEINTLPYEGENICYFQTLGDTEHLIAKIAACTGRGIAYGGSFIACELIDVFLHHGMSTVAAFRGPWMFHRILDEQSGTLVTEHLKRKGADVRPGSESLEAVGGDAGPRRGAQHGRRHRGLPQRFGLRDEPRRTRHHCNR